MIFSFYLRHKVYFIIIGIVLLSNILLYSFLQLSHSIIPFHRENYLYNAHHFLEDPRIAGGNFQLLRALGQYDSQWYLKIAEAGYPEEPEENPTKDNRTLEGLSYAFFPLYPLVLSIGDIFLNNIELTAFFLSNIFLILNLCSLYFIVSKLYTSQLAFKTITLFLLYPFSIFYRSYYAENVFLFLFLWFCYFLKEKKFLLSALFLSMLNITKGNAFLLYFLYLYQLIKHYDKEKKSFFIFSSLVGIPLLFISLWMLYCFIQAGDLFYFMKMRQLWSPSGITAVILNIYYLIITPALRFHSFHSSQVDNVMFISTILLLIKSRKFLPKEFFWSTALLVMVYFIGQDFISFSRSTSLLFPLFIYLAYVLRGKYYIATLILWSSLLLTVSLLFINWYWIG